MTTTPTVVGVGGDLATTDNLNFTISQPSGVQAGDVGLLITYGPQSAPIKPSGWTQIQTANVGAFGFVAWKIYGASEPAASFSYTSVVNTTGFNGQLLVLRGVDAIPIDGSSAAARTSTNVATSGLLTANTANTLMVSTLMARGFATTPTLTPSAGFTVVSESVRELTAISFATKPGPVLNGATGASGWTTDPAFANAFPTYVLFRAAGENSLPRFTLGTPVALHTGDVFTKTVLATDIDGTIVSYAWTLPTKPSGSTATLTGADTGTVSFTPDKRGMYTLSLAVTDNSAQTATQTLAVEAKPDIWTRLSGLAVAGTRRARIQGVLH